MDIPGVLHKIEEDLKLDWVEDLAETGIEELESILLKHQQFALYLEIRDRSDH
jgi:hypothetical protein